MRVTLVAMAVMAALGAGAAHAQDKRLAVLEFKGDGTLAATALAKLSDEARGGALRVVKPLGYVVMTRESMLAILKDMGQCAASEGECEVETARNIGADVVVTGEQITLGAALIVTIKVFETKRGSLLGTRSVEGADVLAVMHGVAPAVESAMHDALDPAPPPPPVVAVRDDAPAPAPAPTAAPVLVAAAPAPPAEATSAATGASATGARRNPIGEGVIAALATFGATVFVGAATSLLPILALGGKIILYVDPGVPGPDYLTFFIGLGVGLPLGGLLGAFGSTSLWTSSNPWVVALIVGAIGAVGGTATALTAVVTRDLAAPIVVGGVTLGAELLATGVATALIGPAE